MPVREPVIDLEHLSADLRVVLDSINEGVHIVDTSGITVFYNKVAAYLDNLNPAEVVGRHILSVFPSLSEDSPVCFADRSACSRASADVPKLQRRHDYNCEFVASHLQRRTSRGGH